MRLPYFGRRRFSLLIDALRTASTTVNLDEIRVFSISGGITASYSQTLLRGTDHPGKLLVQPARRVRGDVFGSTFVLGRRAILLRPLIFFVALAVAVAISVWLRASPAPPASMKNVLIFVVFLGTPSALFFAIRLAWLAWRIPGTVTVDREYIRIARRRYEFADIAEGSLTPPSYAEHMRTLTVRPLRGMRHSWMLGHDQPGRLAEQGFPQYSSFAAAVVTAASASDTALVWDLE